MTTAPDADGDPFAPGRFLAGAGALLVRALGPAAAGARPTQVTYRPGRSITARFRTGDGAIAVVAARRRPLVAGDGAPLAPFASASFVEGGDGIPVHVFRAEDDPLLPGLSTALDPARLRSRLAAAGLAAVGTVATGGPLEARLRAYRPLRRAVVEVAGADLRLFLKVVPVAKAAALHDRHRLLQDRVPVPRVLGWWPADGTVALEALGGDDPTLRDVLASASGARARTGAGAGVGAGVELEIEAILSVLDRLPPALADLPGSSPPAGRVARRASLLAALLPDLGDRLTALVDGIDAVLADRPAPPLVPAHGDLHAGQLVVHGPEVVGLLDLDTAGGGARIDDVANLLGHLSVVAVAPPAAPARDLGRRWMASLDRSGSFDPAELRVRVAAVVLSLAVNSFRTQEPDWPAAVDRRVALAESWLRTAGC